MSVVSKEIITLYEPQHDKTNKMTCAPREDSDQPRHPPSLIRVFAVCMKKPSVLSYPLGAQQRLWSLGGCPGWSKSSLGAQAILLVLSCSCSYQDFLGALHWHLATTVVISNLKSGSFRNTQLICDLKTTNRYWKMNLELSKQNKQTSSGTEHKIDQLSPVKRICVFEHSVMTNFKCACPAIQRGQGSGFLSEGSSWLTACMSEQRRFWRACAFAQARLNLRCSHRR